MTGVDISDELKDLLKVYTDAEEHLKKKEAAALNTLTSYMKQFIDAQAERKKVTDKLNNLQCKLARGSGCGDCQDDQEDDDE